MGQSGSEGGNAAQRYRLFDIPQETAVALHRRLGGSYRDPGPAIASALCRFDCQLAPERASGG